MPAKKIHTFKNINFYNYKGGREVANFETFINQFQVSFQGCGFYDCKFVNSANSFGYVKDCIFHHCTFDGVATDPGQEASIGIHNCNFRYM